jgi:protease-4
MRSFLLGLAAGVVVASLVALGITWGLVAWRERPPSIEQGTTLVLRLRGVVSEKEPSAWLPLDEQNTLTTFGVWRALANAAADPRIAALILEPEHPEAGWAKLAEIRAAVASFARAGKPVAAFLRSPNTRDYYLASAAGRISIAPRDHLDVKGLRAELLYLRDALDKFGILPEFEGFGRYKDAPDVLTRSSMRPETRQVVEALLDARLEELVGLVSEGRKKSKEEVTRLLDEGPYLADTARKTGLIDAVEFEDQMREYLRQRLGQNQLRTVSAEQYQRVPAGRIGLSGPHRIALLAAEGDILRGGLPFPFEQLDPDEFRGWVKRIRKDDAIKAVILRIDSPGGDAIGSDEMLRELELLASKKPLVVSMSDVAASGGYALALAGSRILAHPQSLTGSIGIFYGKLSFAGLYEKLGIRKELLLRGRMAGMDSEARALSEEERNKLRRMLQTMYTDFVAQVAQARRRKPEQIEPAAQGRVWLGRDALVHGLVDELGGIERAIQLAREQAGIPSSEQVRIEPFPPRESWVRSMWRRMQGARPVSFSSALQQGFWKRLEWDVDIR